VQPAAAAGTYRHHAQQWRASWVASSIKLCHQSGWQIYAMPAGGVPWALRLLIKSGWSIRPPGAGQGQSEFVSLSADGNQILRQRRLTPTASRRSTSKCRKAVTLVAKGAAARMINEPTG
jgi:hypothetical protein